MEKFGFALSKGRAINYDMTAALQTTFMKMSPVSDYASNAERVLQHVLQVTLHYSVSGNSIYC